MAAISLSEDTISWNYFGSDHGKADADGELGSINRALDAAIRGRQVVISDAREMTTGCNQEGHMLIDEPGSKRHFHHVANIDRSSHSTKVETRPGIRSLHNIQNTGKPYQLLTRQLSCVCSGCMAGGECYNISYVGPSSRMCLVPENYDSSTAQLQEKSSTSRSEDTCMPIPHDGASFDAHQILQDLQRARTFQSLGTMTKGIKLPDIPRPQSLTVLGLKRNIDKPSLGLMASDIPHSGDLEMYPISITAELPAKMWQFAGLWPWRVSWRNTASHCSAASEVQSCLPIWQLSFQRLSGWEERTHCRKVCHVLAVLSARANAYQGNHFPNLQQGNHQYLSKWRVYGLVAFVCASTHFTKAHCVHLPRIFWA